MPEFLNDVVAAQPPLARALWAVVSRAVLVAALVVLRLERRMFVARGKGASWWVVRLASLPALAVVVGRFGSGGHGGLRWRGGISHD